MMKTINSVLFLITILFFGVVNAQEKSTEVTQEAKLSYYQKRAKEDAKYEQEFNAETKKEAKKFWKEQKAYEKELRKKDKEAYKAYMQGKRDAYAEHHSHCNENCHHDHYYHNHATFYYRGEYRREPRYRARVGANVRVGLPSVRLGVF